MAKEVKGGDFSDDQLLSFFSKVDRLVWHVHDAAPQWVRDEAERFAEQPPTPEPDEMREFIDQAVAMARGWDEPDNPQGMLHSAIKAWYLTAWYERLLEHAGKNGHHSAYGIRFTPVFRNVG